MIDIGVIVVKIINFIEFIVLVLMLPVLIYDICKKDSRFCKSSKSREEDN
jgi:hypothetical protein